MTSRSENSEGPIVIEFDLSRNITSRTNPDDQPIITVSLQSEKYPMKELMYCIGDRLKDQF